LLPNTPYSFFFGLIWQGFRWRVAGLTLCAAAGIGLMSLEPLLLRGLFDALNQSPPEPSQVWPWFVGMALAWLGSSVANRLREWVDLHTSPALRTQAQLALYHWLDQHSPRFFQNEMVGGLSQKVKQTGLACVLLSNIVFNSFVRMVVAIAMAAVILSTAPVYFFWSFVLWLSVFGVVAVWFARRSVPLFKAFGEQASASTGILADITAQMDLVRSNAQGSAERVRLWQALWREQTASVRTRWFLLFMMAVLYTALIGFQCLFIALAVQAYLDAEMRLGEVMMVVSLAAILLTNVWALFEQLVLFFEQVGTLASALEVIARPHEIQQKPQATALQVSRGEICFEHVHFQYPGAGEVLFSDFCLRVAPGERVGLVGPSGSGKSTLIKLLRRHADVQQGRICIDGQDIAAVTLDSLNAAMADVPQDPALFHRSLRENIAYADPDISEHELQHAVQAAQCQSFVARRVEGLDVLVGERGIRLSGGERQRVALARAFVKDAPILLLDEATSALDSETEKMVQDALERLCLGRTVIAIAHRLSTLTRMDRILVLVQGQIVEQGTHAQLLAGNGPYAKLWLSQTSQ
jgi:ATP-binding cassette, subfamily B, bacterial